MPLSSGEILVVTEPESIRDLATLRAIENADTVAHDPKTALSLLKAPPPPVPPEPLDEEARLRVAAKWEELIEHLIRKIEDTLDPAAKAQMFRRIADVFYERLGDADQTLDALIEALVLDPREDVTANAIERVAAEHNKWSYLVVGVDDAMAQCTDRDRQVKLCEHLIRWCTGEKAAPELIVQYKERIRRLDPKHPLMQIEVAAVYKDRGSYALAKEALVNALHGLWRRDKVPVLTALGDLHEFYLNDAAEAERNYADALEIDPSSSDALEGLERVYRALEKYRELETILERQARSDTARLEDRLHALMRLAVLNEKHFLRYDAAATMLSEVLDLDPLREEALLALERCQIAQRDWTGLVDTLDLRLRVARDNDARLELLTRIAEVCEIKLGDLHRAVAMYERISAIDPRSQKVLGELARLSEKRQDWGAAAAYRAQLAQMSPDASQAAQILVQIGDMLAAPGRDQASARHYYERALTKVPTHAGAWEALQRQAEREGDVGELAHCLERRALITDLPRLKAQLLVELAKAKKQIGAESGAFAAYEEAIQVDPSNEAAAAEMLPVYTKAERWPEAAPLCEVLFNAASRDGEHERSVELLRLASRIATSMNNLERALIASLAAHELDRRSAEGQRELLAMCHLARKSPELLERVRPALETIAGCADDLSAESLVYLAETAETLGDTVLAKDALDRALAKAPANAHALAVAAEVHADRGNFDQAAAFKLRLAEATEDPNARYDLLVEAGEIWTHRAGNLDKAAGAFEEALRLRPQDSWLLHTLLWLYGELERWEKLIETLRSVAGLYRDAVKKAKAVFTMAQVVRDKLGDAYRAAELFEETIAIDATRLDAFERVVRIYTEAKDWRALEKSYRRMIHRTNDDDVELRHALFHQLGLIYRDRIGDADGALEAFRAAGALKPSEENRQIVTELHVVTGRFEEAIRETRASLARDPSSVGLYSTLYDLFLRARTFDKAWCAVDVLSHLGPLTAEQRKFHDDYPPPPTTQVPGTITAAHWRSHIFHRDLDPTVTTILSVMAQVTARARAARVPAAQRSTMHGETMRANHSYNAAALLEAVTSGAAILGVSAPLVLARRGPPQPLVIAPAGKPALLSNCDALDTLSQEALAFLVGKRLAELRPELFGRAIFPTLTEMTAALAMAVRLARRTKSNDSTESVGDRELANQLTESEFGVLRDAVARATSPGTRLDIKQWARLADLSSTRAGLLLCGQVEYARRAMLQDGQLACDLPPRERVQQMCLFAVSDELAELRRAIGINSADG